jgi:hypothetical protein
MPDSSGKLIATAVGAAAAGAALAVVALKLIEKKEDKTNTNTIHRGAPHISYIRNEEDSQATLNRTSSEALLFPHNHEEKMRRRIASRYAIEEDNTSPRNSVTVRVPASSANVGPGCTLSSLCLHQKPLALPESHSIYCTFHFDFQTIAWVLQSICGPK